MSADAAPGVPSIEPLEGDRPLDVVMFGSYDVTLHPRVAVLRDGLADRGHRVTELNCPLGLSTADKIDAASSLSGVLRLLVGIVRSWASLVRAGRRRAVPDLVVVGYLGHFDVHLARLLWPSAPIALDHLVGLADTARDRGVAAGSKYRLLDLLDRAALSRADLIVVDTEEQRQQLPGRHVPRAVVVPVGATSGWFEQAATRSAPPPPLKVCFVGLFTPLHGAPVIGRAIARLADDRRFEFTMVGSGQDLDETTRVAGGAPVTWIDWVAADDLPALVGSQHVCLGIFGTTPKALRVVPTKVYQGLAAGNVVVTSDTGPQRRALGSAAHYVPPGDDAALAACLTDLADSVGADGANPSDASTRFRPDRVVGPILDRMSTMSSRRMTDGPALSPSACLRFDLLRTELEALPPGSVLEIGPGRGAIAARLVAAGHEYTGVELSEESRASTAELLASIPGVPARMLGSLDELADGETADALCAFEVLEHIEDDRAALAEWAARVTPGGRLFLSVPAWQERFSAADEEVGHFRRYAPEELSALAESVGLVDVRVRGYGFPLGDALDRARGVVAARAQRRRASDAEPSIEDRTKGSGAWMQPPRSMNAFTWASTWPFRVVQRRFPDRGAGLVMTAVVPGRGPVPLA